MSNGDLELFSTSIRIRVDGLQEAERELKELTNRIESRNVDLKVNFSGSQIDDFRSRFIQARSSAESFNGEVNRSRLASRSFGNQLLTEGARLAQFASEVRDSELSLTSITDALPSVLGALGPVGEAVGTIAFIAGRVVEELVDISDELERLSQTSKNFSDLQFERTQQLISSSSGLGVSEFVDNLSREVERLERVRRSLALRQQALINELANPDGLRLFNFGSIDLASGELRTYQEIEGQIEALGVQSEGTRNSINELNKSIDSINSRRLIEFESIRQRLERARVESSGTRQDVLAFDLEGSGLFTEAESRAIAQRQVEFEQQRNFIEEQQRLNLELVKLRDGENAASSLLEQRAVDRGELTEAQARLNSLLRDEISIEEQRQRELRESENILKQTQQRLERISDLRKREFDIERAANRQSQQALTTTRSNQLGTISTQVDFKIEERIRIQEQIRGLLEQLANSNDRLVTESALAQAKTNQLLAETRRRRGMC